jgi:hypothetical protein
MRRINRKTRRGGACRSPKRKGAVLLIVLFVVMVITIVSLGFISKSDVELACGQNIVMRMQMDHLAESGLEHARGLILNPQDVDTQYWGGDIRQQLVPGGNDYYDVNVVQLGECNYQIACIAYREKNGQRTGRSDLMAELRLDPCIALWCGADTTISGRITINGDVYCNGHFSGGGYVDGDVFASGNITATNVVGGINEAVAQAPVSWPGLQVSDFSSSYYIGSISYSTQIVDSNVHPVGSFIPSPGNPAGVRYCSGEIKLPGNVNIEGMLVVNGNLRINGANNVIDAVKNFPALLVGGEVIIEDGGVLEVRGLAQIGQRITVSSGAQNMVINGGLFIANGGIEGSASSSIAIVITAGPAIAAIQTWPVADNCVRWTPAGGAFFRSITRQ